MKKTTPRRISQGKRSIGIIFVGKIVEGEASKRSDLLTESDTDISKGLNFKNRADWPGKNNEYFFLPFLPQQGIFIIR
jgi:hypothetical protein